MKVNNSIYQAVPSGVLTFPQERDQLGIAGKKFGQPLADQVQYSSPIRAKVSFRSVVDIPTDIYSFSPVRQGH